MRIGTLILACLAAAALAASANAGIGQQFDRSGRLLPAGQVQPGGDAGKVRPSAVPESLQLRPDVAYQFYPVFGRTFAEIMKSVGENSPLDEKTGKRQPFVYDWGMGWTYDFSFTLEEDDDDDKVHCDIVITGPVISYALTATLPTLTDDSALNPVEKNLWKNYVASLLERIHARIRIIRDEPKNDLSRQFGELTYLLMSEEEAARAQSAVEQFLRKETAKIGSSVISQINGKLEAADYAKAREDALRPVEPMPGRKR